MTTKLALPPERQGRIPPPELAQRRAQFAAAVAAGTWNTDRPPLETMLAGCRTLRFRPGSEAKGRVLHFHGGGFRVGGPEFAGRFAEALARRCQVEVVAPEYRLAPEHPFPAGLGDALACLEGLRQDAGADTPLIISGDSAGAGLAASLGVLVSTGGAPRTDGLVLLSPWLDLTLNAPSYTVNAATDTLFSKEAAESAADLYLQGFDRLHPLASPLHAAFSAYPPTLIIVGSGEVLLDDSLRFHEKLQATGNSSILDDIEGMQHVAVVRDMELPGAAAAFTRIASFIDHIVARAGDESE
jgi:monoterpene epsilon-lactone hydrolase